MREKRLGRTETESILQSLVDVGFEETSVIKSMSKERLRQIWYSKKNNPTFVSITSKGYKDQAKFRLTESHPEFNKRIIAGFQCMLQSKDWDESSIKYQHKYNDIKTHAGFISRMCKFALEKKGQETSYLSFSEALAILKLKIFSPEEKDVVQAPMEQERSSRVPQMGILESILSRLEALTAEMEEIKMVLRIRER